MRKTKEQSTHLISGVVLVLVGCVQNPSLAGQINSTAIQVVDSIKAPDANSVENDSIANIIMQKGAGSQPNLNAEPKFFGFGKVPREILNIGTDDFGLRSQHHVDVLLAAEAGASPAGKGLLAMSRKMALEDKEILRGSCWDYINELFNRTGYPAAKRQKVHAGSYASGPYADGSQFEAGDWLYFINHSYHDIEHSSMFIGWVDQASNTALMLTYGGENRAEPARFREYDLSHVYSIIRAVD